MASDLFAELTERTVALQPGLGVSAMKHNLAAAGVIRSARVRHPTSALDPRSLNELRRFELGIPQ